MVREVTMSADTVDEAIEKACEELGVAVGEYPPEILQLPKKGLFGKIKKQAIVKLVVDDGQPDPVVKKERKPRPEKQAPKQEKKPAKAEALKEEKKAEPKAQPKPEAVKEAKPEKPAVEEKPVDPEELERKIKVAQEYMQAIFAELGLENITFAFNHTENKTVQIHLEGDDIGTVIGKRGETLDAIQYLVCLAANRLGGDYIRFTINAGNYREKREETLRALAQRMAKKVLKTGRPAALEPMNPYERRIIHAVVTEIDGVYSKSSGEEPNRRIVIKLTKGNDGDKGEHRSEGGRSRGRRGGRNRSDRPRREERPRTESAAVSEEPAKEPMFDESKLGDIKLYGKIEL